MRRLLRLIAVGILIFTAAFQAASGDQPSESECRPHIEKALKGLNTPDTQSDQPLDVADESGSIEDGGGLDEGGGSEEEASSVEVMQSDAPDSSEQEHTENTPDLGNEDDSNESVDGAEVAQDAGEVKDTEQGNESVEQGAEEGSAEQLVEGESAEQTAENESVEQTEGSESVEQAEGSESVEQAEGGESVEQTEGGESVEQAEGGESVEQAEGSESVEQAEGGESVEQAEGESVEQAEGDESVEQAEGESVEQAEGGESVEHADGGESGEQAEGGESVEQAEGGESVEQAEGGESVEQAEGGESVEQAEGGESVEQAEGDESVEQAEGDESVEQAEGGESGEQAEGDESGEQAEGESVEQAEGSESVEQAEGGESVEQAEGESVEQAEGESVEQTEGGESVEQAEGGESVEQAAEGESAEQTAEGESAEQAVEGESVEQAAEGESAEQAAESESAEQATEGESVEQAAEGESAEQAAQGESVEQAADGESVEQAAEGESVEQAAEGESVEQAAEGESVEQAPEGESVEQAVEGESVEQAAEGESAEQAVEGSEEASSESTLARGRREVGEEPQDEEALEAAPEAKVEVVDEEAEPTPEEELSFDVEIPENLRPRDHIAQILKLDEESIEDEILVSKTADATLKDLKRFYDTAIKPLEILYKYRDLSNRHFGDPEIFSKPLILFMGPWSGGKSSIINYLLDNEYKRSSLRTGAEPSPAYFNILMWGEREEVLDGTQLAADWTFSGLQKFGQGLLDRLRGLRLNNRLLEKVNIVEIPGILEIRKQVERLFPFNDACQWFIDRADIIFLVYDPSKLDVGPETEAILDQLKGREYQTRIILNKADQVRPEELMRVQGTLIWNISPLMSSTQPPVMYSTSLWSMPYELGAPLRLLRAQERAFLRDMREAVDKRVENKIASARRFAVRVRNHAKMVDCYLTTYYNHKSFFGNRKKISDDIIEKPQDYHIYEGLSTLTNISRYDLPDPETYRDFFRVNPLYEFELLASTCTYFKGCPINRLDVAIAYDLPELVGRYKKASEAALEKKHDPNKS